MAKSRGDWMKKGELERLAQFNTYTLKLPNYAVTFGLTAAEVTAARNDYLWAKYAFDLAKLWETEWGGAVDWKTQLNNGEVPTVQLVPSIGTELQPPAVAAVADGILRRWRAQAEDIKTHAGYTVAIGKDLEIEAPEDPVQQMKPTAKFTTEPGGVVRIKVRKDGHDAVIVMCQRGPVALPEELGSYTKATIVDDRANLVAGVPEKRVYTLRYEDGDVPVGEISDAVTVSTQA